MVLDIQAVVAAHREAVDCVEALETSLQQAAERLRQTFAQGHRVYTCGNGGSAADAQHFAAELTGRYDRDRRGFPAIALTTDTSALTSIGNDYGFEALFARQLESLAVAGDLLLAISTSGNSTNIVKAVEHARANGIYTIGLLGRDGGCLAELVDLPLIINAQKTGRIQEAHILILHLLCEVFE
jgi:D-sedoheptulose 7-phosphate isomerase